MFKVNTCLSIAPETGWKLACPPGCHVCITADHSAHKYPWLLHSHLNQEWMPIVPIPTSEKRQTLVQFLSGMKGVITVPEWNWVVVFTVGLVDIFRVSCHCGEHVAFVIAQWVCAAQPQSCESAWLVNNRGAGCCFGAACRPLQTKPN